MIYFELFYTFFLIGLFTFGGGHAMIPMIMAQVVGNGWLTEKQLTDFIAISEATPGPFAINISTFCGYEVAGVGGATLATLGVILPSIIIILILAAILTRLIKNKYVQGALNGAKPVIISLILSIALVMFAKTIIYGGNSYKDGVNIDRRSLALLIMLVGFMFIYKKVRKKSLGAITLLGISALIGIVIYAI